MEQKFNDIAKRLQDFIDCQLYPLDSDNFFHSDPGILLGKDGSVLGLNLHGIGLVDEQLYKLISRNTDLFSPMRYLDLSNNELEYVAVLNSLKNLIKVDLASNKIADLSFVLELNKLETANLRCNNLQKVPEDIFKSRLEVKVYDDWNGGLILEGNPIQEPSFEHLEKMIARQKAERYEKLMKEGVFSRNECRVQLIGSGGAGKTTLAKSLAGREHLPNEPATQGMAIWETSLEDIRIKIWDFGGQEAMFSMHRLFIAGGEIFLIVLDSRHNESAQEWIEFVLSFSHNAKFIIIMNKIDENKSFDLDHRLLRRMYPNRIMGFFRISANRKTDRAFIDFKKCLKTILSEYAKVELPSEFKSLLYEFERGNEAYIREEDFRKTYSDLGLNVGNLDLAIDQLIRIGIVIRTELSMAGVILIRTAWLAKNIYPLLEPDISLREDVENGLISEDSLFKIWVEIREKEVNENIDLDKSKLLFPQLIEIMERNDLCYRTSDGSLFIPNFLSSKSPEITNKILETESHLHFIFKCTFLPKLLFQRLHVEVGRRYNMVKRWKSGFIITGAKNDFEGNFTCIVTGDFFNREIKIISSGRHLSTGFRDMYNVVKESLGNIGEMPYQEFIIFSELNVSENRKTDYLLRFEDILFYNEMGVNEYLSGQYRRAFSVDDVLSGIHKDVIPHKKSAVRETNIYYNYGHIGSQGSGAKTSQFTISPDLSDGLMELCKSLKQEDADKEKIKEVELAVEAVNNNNSTKAHEYLNKIGAWGIERADKIGVTIVTTAIKSAMGY